MQFYFKEKPVPYNLRDGRTIVLPKMKSCRFGIYSLRFRGIILLNNVPVSKFKCI